MFEQANGGYQAILRYETTRVITTAQETPGAALEELIRTLHGQGYSQLRSQLSVREGIYLGSQEPWIEYPDPASGYGTGGRVAETIVSLFPAAK